MYDVEADPYSYPGTNVLKNKLDLKDAAELAAFSAMSPSQMKRPRTLGCAMRFPLVFTAY